jgi:hypothetical protein
MDAIENNVLMQDMVKLVGDKGIDNRVRQLSTPEAR